MCHWGGIRLTHPTENAAIPIGGYLLIQVDSMKVQIF